MMTMATPYSALLLLLVLILPTVLGESYEAVDKMFENYDKSSKPSSIGSPTEVGISMYVLDITSLDPETMDFTTTVYFRQHWRDPRLARMNMNWDGKGERVLRPGDEIVERIWRPDTFLPSARHADFHTFTRMNTFVKIDRNGNVVRSHKVTITAPCTRNLHDVPFDHQTCTISVESYGYVAKDIVHEWFKDPNNEHSIGIAPTAGTVDYELVGYCMKDEIITLTTGNYSQLQLEFQFERIMSYYVLSLYVPCGLLVLVSWLSFYIGRKQVAVRAALTVGPLIALVELIVGSSDTLPHDSHIRAIDVYFVASFLHIFIALVAFVFAGRPKGDGDDQKKESALDPYWRIIFPLMFAAFNGVYWFFYLRGDDHCDDMIPFDPEDH